MVKRQVGTFQSAVYILGRWHVIFCQMDYISNENSEKWLQKSQFQII